MLKIVLMFKSEKKYSIRYDASVPIGAPITAIYVSKKSLPQPWPKAISVTVEVAGE